MLACHGIEVKIGVWILQRQVQEIMSVISAEFGVADANEMLVFYLFFWFYFNVYIFTLYNLVTRLQQKPR